MILDKQLEQLGLSSKEAKVYWALLELGQSTAQQLAIKSGINRATTYVALESLRKKSLLKTAIKNKKTFFILEDPEQILDLLEKEKRSIENKIVAAQSILPLVEDYFQLTGEKAKIRFFERIDGIKMIQKDILKTKPKMIDNIFNINIALKFFPSQTNDHRQHFKKRKIAMRSIVIYDPKEPIPKLPLMYKEERKYVPLNKFLFNADFALYKNKSCLLSIRKEIMGVVIENKDIFDGLSTLFEMAWQGTEKYQVIK